MCAVNVGDAKQPQQPQYLPGETFTYELGEAPAKHYSEALLKHVKACLEFNPASRPSFSKLRRDIDEFLAGGVDGDGSLQTYMRHAKRDSQAMSPQHALSFLPAEKYKLGFALPGPVAANRGPAAGGASK